MSMYCRVSKPSLSEISARRRFWAAVFASTIQYGRLAIGLSVEDAAQLAGSSACEWAAMEQGHVPLTAAQLRSIAGTLEIHYDRLLNLVLLCRDAWEL